MYLRSKHAAAWPGDAAAVKPRQPAHSTRQTVWASVPFQGRLGPYIGVRLRNGAVFVAVAGENGLRWVPAERALSEAEAARWARSSFRP